AYFLLVGRQSSESGLYQKFWVYLSLPSSGPFSCYTTGALAIVIGESARHCDRKFKELNSEYSAYPVALIEGFKIVKAFVEKEVVCCSDEGGIRSECVDCPNSISSIRQLMEENGFVGILVDSLAYTDVNTTSGVVDVYAQ